MEFNEHSRKANALLVSASGVIQQAVQVFGNFIYRTIFLMFLTKEYLGIQGLFSNILQLFSLAELGIGSAILYSMYKPFAEHDSRKISALVRFYSKVYHLLALLVLIMGFCFYPFIGWLVDVSEVPADVNLTVVYFLFVLQSVVSYLFVYRQSLLSADQRNHVVSLFNCGLLLTSYVIRSIVLACTKNFELVLLSDIVTNLVLNGLFSLWITRRYGSVFRCKEELPREEKMAIFKNTGGLLCHKIGSVVVTSTDNIVLTKFVSLVATGIYSNYATIVLAITNLANRVLSGLIPTIANYILNKTKEESHKLFRCLLYGNLWIASFTTVCLYLLLNPFIEVWQDSSFLLEQSVVAWICLQHYLQVARLSSNVFISGCGLFMRDRVRPLIESVLNIVVSVVLAQRIGIQGVFIGTCVSGVCTYFWREPYLVFKNYFHRSQWGYWVTQAAWMLLTLAMCAAGQWLFAGISSSLAGFMCKMLIAAVVPNVLILLLTCRTEECRYFLGFANNLIRKKRGA